MTNLSRVEQLLKECASRGVTEYCLCAGARNSPLLLTLAQAEGVKLWNFFDERAASFFALGRIKSTQRPVAVICTSGTAALEMVAATAEAYYTNLPLICITADRPLSYRGTGAPQSIDQTQAFKGHVEAVMDVSEDQSTEGLLKSWSGERPLQINICFAEPLVDGEIQKLQLEAKAVDSKRSKDLQSFDEKLNSWAKTTSAKKPLVILGPLSLWQAEVLRPWLLQLGLPIYAEASSQLRRREVFPDQLIQSGADFVTRSFHQGDFDSVLRIGGVPTLRLWRDLEDQLSKVPVLSLSSSGFSGLSRKSESLLWSDYEVRNAGAVSFTENTQWRSKDQKYAKQVIEILNRYPRSELTLVRRLSQELQPEDSLYLGNSLPVREWDFVADLESTPWRVEVNRGINGIDGQLSSFLGQAEKERVNWALLGDLTTLYDATAPWVESQKPGFDQRVVIINNSGGQIFHRMFKHPVFINAHEVSFKKWADWWNWSYTSLRSVEDFAQLQPHQVIELIPDPEQSDKVWEELLKCLKKN